MRSHLVFHVGQIGIDGQRISTCILHRTDALGLGLNGSHDAQLVDIPEEGWLPIAALQDSLQGLIGRNLIGTLFASDSGDGITK